MTTPKPSPGHLAQIACILEVSARKPGNVHLGLGFADTHFLDFVLSASAIAGPLDRAPEIGVGAAVLRAVEATRLMVATNTNLGMILLLAPLTAVPEGLSLRDGVASVLNATTREDARHVYQAIRLARPGGLGRAAEQDVADEPTVTLLEAMRLASDRDLVAAQYANGYADVFDLALPPLRSALERGRPLEAAIVTSFLTVLANRPDTLIARKLGWAEAREVSRGAGEILEAGGPDTSNGRALNATFDLRLRADGHTRNPGATADLISAALFVALHDGTIRLPASAGPAAWSLG